MRSCITMADVVSLLHAAGEPKKDRPSYKTDPDDWAKSHHIDLDDILDNVLGNVPDHDGDNDHTPSPK
jgi:hypothetical protein